MRRSVAEGLRQPPYFLMRSPMSFTASPTVRFTLPAPIFYHGISPAKLVENHGRGTWRLPVITLFLLPTPRSRARARWDRITSGRASISQLDFRPEWLAKARGNAWTAAAMTFGSLSTSFAVTPTPYTSRMSSSAG